MGQAVPHAAQFEGTAGVDAVLIDATFQRTGHIL